MRLIKQLELITTYSGKFDKETNMSFVNQKVIQLLKKITRT